MGKNSFTDMTIFKPQNPETKNHFEVSGNRGPIPMQQPDSDLTGDGTSAAQATSRVMKLAGPHPGLRDRLSLQAVSQVRLRGGEVVDYLVTRQNPEAKVGLGFYPTLDQLVTTDQLSKYLKNPQPSR